MRKSLRNKQEEIPLSDLYAMKVSALWKTLTTEHVSLLMLCIYFFFEYVRPQTLYPVLDVAPWAQMFLLASIVSALMDKSSTMTSNVENKLMILFAVIVVLSGIFAFRPSVALDNWSVFGGWFLVYFLVTGIVNTEKRMIIFLLAYSLYSFKMSQHGAVSWAMRGFSFTTYGLVGSPGWFRNSGEYAIQMLIFAPLAISIVVSLKDYWGRYKKWFLIAIAATGYMAVIGASSRGAQIGLAVVGIWFLLKQKNGFKGLFSILVIAALLYSILPDEQLARFEEMGDDKNSLQRLEYWKFGLFTLIPQHPILGVGYFNWLPYLSYMVPEGMGPYQIIEVSHNIYIQAASEMGIIGLIIFLFMVLYAFINNARTRVMAKALDKPLLFNLSYGLDAGLIGFLVAGSFVTVLFYPFFWVQLAMIVMLNNITSRLHAEMMTDDSSLSGRKGRRRKRGNGRRHGRKDGLKHRT